MIKNKSNLVAKKIRDKNGKLTTVWVKSGDEVKEPHKKATPEWKKPIETIGFHGTVYSPFKKFKTSVAFLSESYTFARDYADQKSFDSAMDADIRVATVKFKGVMFNPENDYMMKEISDRLPKKIRVHDGLFGMTAEISKKDFMYNLRGLIRKEPNEDIKGKKVGDEFIWKYMANEKRLIISEDDQYVRTVSVNALNRMTTTALRTWKEYKQDWDNWKDKLWDVAEKQGITKDTGMSKSYTLTYDFQRLIDYVAFWGSGYEKTKLFNDLGKLTLKVKDDIINHTINTKPQDEANNSRSLYTKHFNKVEVVEDMKDNWNFMENDVILNIMNDLGYDAYQAWEKGAKTIAVLKPQKTLKIEKWT